MCGRSRTRETKQEFSTNQANPCSIFDTACLGGQNVARNTFIYTPNENQIVVEQVLVVLYSCVLNQTCSMEERRKIDNICADLTRVPVYACAGLVCACALPPWDYREYM